MQDDCELRNVVDSVIYHTLDIWDEVKLISKYKHGRHETAWQTFTVAEQAEIQCRLAIAWMRLGMLPGERVAIMAVNRPRWIFTLNGLLAAHLVAVPIYPTLTAEQAAYILNHSGAKYVVVDTLAQAEKIASVLDRLPRVKGIYIMDVLERQPDAPLYAFDALLALAPEPIDARDIYVRARDRAPAEGEGVPPSDDGAAQLCERIRGINGEDLAAIVYTSGTTGDPKGVMLTHQNFLSQRPVQKGFHVGRDDVFLNHLPFSHCFGLTADLFGTIEMRATLVIADGIAPEQIRHALHSIEPTVIMSVPRFFEKTYMQIQQTVEQRPKIARRLLAAAVRVGIEVQALQRDGHPLPAGLRLKYRLSRRITDQVLCKAGLRRLHLAYAGGAPISPELCLFFEGLGIPVYQGYGLTETSPVVTVNLPGRNKPGTVGLPIEGMEIATAEDGEILVRGKCVMKGYFDDPAETARVIDGEGWLHTGDVGQIDSDGYLRIVDRKKELIVTSNGKNIAPLAVESAFNTDPFINRVAVIGEGRNFISALVFPEFDHVRQWAARQNLAPESDHALVSHPAVRALFEERIALVNERLARYEQIKKFALVEHVPNVDTGEITPTEKIKRRHIEEKYRDIIEGMYT
ncbi:MAG: Long-chain-fatty-acid--CoA ligase FadD15 [Candidatus Hydrogenedentes bacterium ADurb.Bin101]|nr:MAG: Long-chain-fatty-acid--CoA ligase FadD15 [Candidatus Hydrogenedentes bacterium ADurb.Bin101]